MGVIVEVGCVQTEGVDEEEEKEKAAAAKSWSGKAQGAASGLWMGVCALRPASVLFNLPFLPGVYPQQHNAPPRAIVSVTHT